MIIWGIWGRPSQSNYFPFSCSFWQKLCQIIGRRPHPRALAPLGNPGSATAHDELSEISLVRDPPFHFPDPPRFERFISLRHKRYYNASTNHALNAS